MPSFKLIYVLILIKMKRNVFIIAFLAMSFMAMAQQWTGLGSNTPTSPQIRLISSSEQQIIVDFTLKGFNMTKVSTPNGIQQIITVPKMASMLETGAPDLPQFPIPAIIGDRAEMKVSVTRSDYTDYENIEIAPSKGNLSRQIDPESVPYTYGEMYNKNAFYPAIQAHLESPYIVRDFRGQNIMVTPFAYNPVKKTLRVYHSMTIVMNKVSDNGQNQKVASRSNQKMSSEMKASYEHRFINYRESASRYTFLQGRGEMLVICPSQYMEAMQPFVDWKNQSGRPTTMVSLSDAGGNSDTQIKAYIQNIYNNPERNLEYVLLVGDYAELTPHSMSGGRSDNWFGQLEGDDYYIEVFTGRFSVESVQDVVNQVNKVIYYERDITENATWLNRGLGVAANEGAGNGHNGGEADYVHMDYIRDTLMHYTYETVTQQYSGVGSGTSANAISNDINNGVSIINYCNHGSQTSWAVASYSNSHVNALVNDDMWPFVWSVACYNGQFDGTCFAEAWLRASNSSTGRPTGAIGGMFSWISQPWTPPMTGQDEMIDILTEWKYNDQFNHTFGEASLNGNMYVLDMHPSDNGATHNTWLLFGDPSLMVRTDNPTRMNVSCNPSTLMLGMSSMEVTAQNTAFGIATLMMDGEVISTGYIQNGTVTLEFPPMSNVGNATLTVMGYNKVTEVVDIEVLPAEGAFLTVNAYTPDVAPLNQVTNLSLTLKNVGADPTTGITTVSLTCDDNRLEIINEMAECAVLSADATITLQDAFSFIIAEGVEDGTRFQIDVEMTCGTETWTGKVYVTAAAAVLEYQRMSWEGGFTPGETLTLSATFKNVGHWPATNAQIALTTTSEYVTVNTQSVVAGTLEVGQEVTYDFSVTIAANCPETEQMPVTFTMTADGGLTAQGTETLKNACNVVFNLMDSYGDGWNGNVLTASFDDGTPSQEMTFSSGSSAEYVLEIGNGTHVTLTWTTGSYASECSFTVSYEGDLLIYQSSGTPSAGVLYEFDCNCAAASQTFMVTVASENTEYGTVSGGGEFSFGESCTVTATANEGYFFTGWTWNGEAVSSAATYTFNVTNDMDLVAHFAEGNMIGDGGEATDQYLPSYSYYNYTLSQQIYTVEELGAAGMITSIAFYNGGTEKTRTYEFYMKTTEKSSFANGADWEVVTEADKVFSGSVTMVANDWTFIMFDTPFIYDGTTNVVLVADDNTGSYTGSPHMSCRVFEAPSQAIYVYNDGTNYDPYAPTGYSGTMLNVKNQLLLTKEPFSDCMTPTQLTATEVGPDFAVLSWNEVGASEEWVVVCNGNAVEATTNEGFVLVGLEPETEYTITVRPTCDENLFSAPIVITTLEACPTPQNVEVSNITGNAATASWAGYSESYNVQLGLTNFVLNESFGNGIPADWDNTSDYPWTLVDGYMQSGNAGVSNSTSSISATVTFIADGTVEFDAECLGEGTSTYWDHCDFYIDDERVLYIGAGVSGWNHYSFEVTAGEHTFMWSYTKDGSVNPTGDHFAVDNVTMGTNEITWNDPVAVESTVYRFTGLEPMTTYCMRVQGVCGETETEWSETVLFTTTEETTVTQTVSLSSGYNWFSANVEITLEDLQAALVAALPGTTITINSQSDGSTTYNGVRWRGTLTTLDLSQMYMINVSANSEITLEGMPINSADHVITIHPDFNWFVFQLSQSMTLTDAFAGFVISGDMVTSQDGGSSTYTNRWRGTLETLEPGKGYMYKSAATEDRTFTFPANAK